MHEMKPIYKRTEKCGFSGARDKAVGLPYALVDAFLFLYISSKWEMLHVGASSSHNKWCSDTPCM